MTTITTSSYSPNSLQPLAALSSGQVTLLNKGKVHDISQRVKTVVQSHLGYLGREVFKTTFTKQEITFTLRNGDAAEDRTLKLENGQWKLSKNNVHVKNLDQSVKDDVNTLVTEILANIGQASTANAPDPAAPAAAVDGADRPAAANNAELIEIRERLAALEGQLKANPTLERSVRIQQEILREVSLLRDDLDRRPEANTAERDLLQRRVAELQRTLDKREKAFQRLISEGKAEFESLQKVLASDRQQLSRQQQAALDEKDQAALALQRSVADLEAAVSQKETDQRRTLEEFDAFKAQKESIQRQLHDQCARHVQAADERVARYEKVARDAAELTNRGVTVLKEEQAQKAALEQQLQNKNEAIQLRNSSNCPAAFRVHTQTR